MPFPVKNYRSDDPGLAMITSTPGGLVALLDACLVTGFNLNTLDSLSYDSQADTFTGTCNAGHSYRVGQILLVASASPAEFNCELRVTAITATTFTAVGHVDDARPAQADASGSMTVKVAPQGGWSKPYVSGDGLKAVFRMDGPDTSGCCLRVDNSIACHTSYGMYALVDAYEQMTDLDTGSNYFGYLAEHNNAWSLRAKTSYLDTPWILIADKAAFWLSLKIIASTSSDVLDMAHITSTQFWHTYFFGDVIRRAPGDTYSCLLTSSGYSLSLVQTSDHSGLVANHCLFDHGVSNGQGLCLARDLANNVGKKIPYGTRMPWNTSYSGRGALAYPAPADNSLLVQQHGSHLLEASNSIRGQLPGLWTSPQYLDGYLSPTTLLENFPGAEGRQFMTMYAQYQTTTSAASTSYTTVNFIDLTGPWR